MKPAFFTIILVIAILSFAQCDNSDSNNDSLSEPDELNNKIPGKILLEDNFESSILNTSIWLIHYDKTKSYAATIVPNPIGTDNVIRFELHKTDGNVKGNRRAEISMRSPSKEIPQNGERWYAFRIFIPLDYQIDAGSSEILAQWHGQPDTNNNGVEIEPSINPCLALSTNGDHWSISRLWDETKISQKEDLANKIMQTYSRESFSLGPYKKGEWTNWVFHVKWGWNSSHDTKLEIYMNGELVANLNGKPNASNDDLAPYLKLGIYKWDWVDPKTKSTLSKRVVYYDSFKIGDENCCLADVAP